MLPCLVSAVRPPFNLYIPKLRTGILNLERLRVQSPYTGGLSHSFSHGGHFALALVAGSGAGAASMVLVSALLFRRRNRGGRLARRELESA